MMQDSLYDLEELLWRTSSTILSPYRMHLSVDNCMCMYRVTLRVFSWGTLQHPPKITIFFS